ncbi:hypothetical protein GCM10011348_38940 [Marinobacterium nitratireducens]|uniref:Hydrogenase maturation protease n=1 Tax=Marinobacterium nitratireducens TaxID=518897 RepID=A0A917ZM73_9GAMM|nr:hydrogenase maturation protease [Marinobacterium nitratireducens]GGO86922.1 hypothetical protein GCM10011348_38940 [Marinobacterium nitratireducens]
MNAAIVLSLGHPLRSDDGFGERLLQRFEQRYEIPEQVLCLHGGTRPVAHYDRIAGCRWLIVLDAVRYSDAGSDLRVIDPLPVLDCERQLAVHELGLAELLQLMAVLGEAPARVSLVGAAFASLDWGPALSRALEQRLPQACERLATLLEHNGIRLRQRAPQGDPACTS